MLANRENGHFLDKSQYLMLENDEWGHNQREIPSNRGPIMQLFHWSNTTKFLLCVQEGVTHSKLQFSPIEGPQCNYFIGQTLQ